MADNRWGHGDHKSPNGHTRFHEYPADRGKLFKIIKLLYGLMGLQFFEEAEPMDAVPDVLDYFIFSFTADFRKIIEDYIAEAK
ncbi:MAG: hypothetical protein RR981_03850 [Oscillospiraceae bacterium]